MLPNFEKYLLEEDTSPATRKSYLGDLGHFSRWYKEKNQCDFTPELLTPTDARQYRQHLQTAQYAPATINRRLAALRTFAEWAQKSGLLVSNPLKGVRGIEAQKHAPRWLNKNQQFALWQEAEKDLNAARTEPAQRQAKRNLVMIALLLHTGLRVSELCDLQVRDIEITARKGELTVRAGKGQKQRTIPLNKVARQALETWLEARPLTGGDALLTGKQTEALSPRSVERMLAEMGRRAKIEALTPHVLRHTFSKNLVDMGVSLEKVAMLLGHERLETTMIYVTPGKLDLEQAVGMLE